MQRLTNLCSVLNDMEPICVLNHVFVLREVRMLSFIPYHLNIHPSPSLSVFICAVFVILFQVATNPYVHMQKYMHNFVFVYLSHTGMRTK